MEPSEASSTERRLKSTWKNQPAGLRYLIENECFITCALLPTDAFIDYCKKCGISTSRRELEQYEKLRLLYPIARVKYFKYRVKIEKLSDDRQRELGILQPGEEWAGETKERRSHFDFTRDRADQYLSDGLLWEPSSKRFQSWKKFRDSFGQPLLESFYSIFQCHTLYLLKQGTTHEIGLHWWHSYTGETVARRAKQIRRSAKETISRLKRRGVSAEEAPIICQTIANRYFPVTQSDQRTLSVPSSYHRTWDWFEFRENWSPQATLADLGITTARLRTLQERVSRDARAIDPIERWYEIVRFIALDQRQQLKDKALLAQTFYCMEEMLRLFYEDLTGEKLPAPDETYLWKRSRFYGEGVVENDLKYVESLANKYHLNPRPRLILFVEGDGEFEQFPRIARELFGCDFPSSRILIENLGGVSKFTVDGKYGALARFIDVFHQMQTLVFVVLDREGGVSKVKNALVKKRSQYNPKRYVTKDEYIHIWDRNIELDNFTLEEIAQAMTELSEQGGNRYLFQANEIAERKKGLTERKDVGTSDLLSELYREKCSYGLQKPRLLSILCGYILSSPEQQFDEEGKGIRPIVRVIQTILELESMNHQPENFEDWQINQESGYFGSICE